MALLASGAASRLLTINELAALLSVSPSTIYNRRYSGGDLPPSYNIGGRIRFDEAEVLEWLRQRREGEQ